MQAYQYTVTVAIGLESGGCGKGGGGGEAVVFKAHTQPRYVTATMSLYYEADTFVSEETSDSLQSRVYSQKTKAPAKQIYALVSEATKWREVLTEVVERANLLQERKVSLSRKHRELTDLYS